MSQNPADSSEADLERPVASPPVYEKPVLSVMGNLNDLLAGTGTQLRDAVCNASGVGQSIGC